MINELEAFLRRSISEEQETVALYLERKSKVDEEILSERMEDMKKKLELISYTFNDIIQEEEMHIGQFKKMLEVLNISDGKEQEGEEEATQDQVKINKSENFISVAKKILEFIEEK